MNTNMKTIGIIGGMSWESTALYYSGLNRGIAERLGGLHSASIIMQSVDFQEIVDRQLSNEWDEAGKDLAEIANRLEYAGADAIVLAVNTMHKVSQSIKDVISIPFLDIRDAVASSITQVRGKKALLLGTNYVVRENYYGDVVAECIDSDFELLSLSTVEQDFVHDTIYNELAKGEVSSVSRARIAKSIENTITDKGIDVVILACTELPMLELNKLITFIPVLDSTSIHIDECLDFITQDCKVF